MILLVYSQFKRNIRMWIQSIPVFLMSGFIIGFCLTGAWNIWISYPIRVSSNNSPMPIFLMPIVFGSFTMFLMIKSIVGQILRRLSIINSNLIILGASPIQLSILVGLQLAIISGIGSGMGAIISLPFVNIFYSRLSSIVGTSLLPTIHLHFSIIVLCASVLITSCTTTISGMLNSYKNFVLVQKNIQYRQLEKRVSRKKAPLVFAVLILIAILIYWILIEKRIFLTDLATRYDINLEIIFTILFTVILCVSLFSSRFMRGCCSILLRLGGKRLTYASLALYNIKKQPRLFDGFVKPIAIVTILTSGFSSIISNFLSHQNTYSKTNGNVELLLAVLLYVGAPSLIALANVLSVLMLSKDLSNFQNNQLHLIGYSNRDIRNVIMSQGLICSFVCLLQSMLYSIYLSYIIVVAAKITASSAFSVNLVVITLPAILGSTLIGVIMILGTRRS